jgi:hypothetical protein
MTASTRIPGGTPQRALVPCDNDFERDFATFLDNAGGVRAFARIPLVATR